MSALTKANELAAELRNPEPDPYFQLTGGVQKWLAGNWELREEAADLIEAQAAELEQVKAERDEARESAGLNCAATDSGEHYIIKRGAYTFCGKCGETIRTPTLHERARIAINRAITAERRASEAESALSERTRALTEALSGLADAVTAEVNEKGAGGYLLARLSDARDALAALSAPNQGEQDA